MSSATDVAIVGAGPYGLSIAAHLRGHGVPFRIFGEPMRTWRQMARGMYLKSFGFATSVYTPQGLPSFVDYCRERGLEHHEPCAIADFADYGIWLQKQAAPELEQVEVTGVSTTADGGFQVTLQSGETFRARRVVVAAGLGHFVRMPAVLAGLPRTLASHTAHHHDYSPFAGKQVCVVGAGQSALEAAALLHEGGAHPQILVRGPKVIFLGRMPAERPLWDRLKAPLSGLGPGMKSFLLETFPTAVHYAPDGFRVRLVRRHLGPSGSWWLRERVEGKVPIHTGCSILEATERGGRAALRVRQDGREREIETDHVIAGSGFETDVDRLSFLDQALRARIRRIGRAPRLDRHFQASVPGVYFVGPASAMSFGPLFRFVVGAEYAAPALANHLARAAGAAVAPAPGVSPSAESPAGSGA
jgi:FAD-dependent urate hydroxylase